MFSKAVIDTGPLFDALVLNYHLQRAQYGRPLRCTSVIDEVLQNASAQRRFLELLASIQEKLTTSHVIAELYGLRSKLDLHPPDSHYFWRTSIDLLVQWRIEEKLIKLLDLNSDDSLRNCLPRIGVTDTGLIDLAARHSCILITRDEGTLFPEACSRHVDCRLVKQLVPLV